MRMILNVGDWSDDGHGKNEKYVFDVNYPVEEIREAYKASCRKTGISFNHNEDFTERKRDWREADKYRLFTDYGTAFITKLQFDILKEYIPEEALKKFFREYSETREVFYLNDPEYFPELWWEFVKISIPEVEATLIEEDIPEINGFGGLPVQFGYGLFD